MRTGQGWIVRIACATVLSFCGSAAVYAAGAAAKPYTVINRWTVGGAGGWDYLTVDAPRHRLFVTRGNRADVIDTETGKIIGSIAGEGGAHGVALAPDMDRGFLSNGAGNSITEFNYSTLATTRTVPAHGKNPDAIVYDQGTHRLLSFNGKSNDVTVLDATTLDLLGTVSVPGKPEFAQMDGHGHVYANIETEPGQLVRIDIAAAKLEATWPLDGCNSPSGLAFDRARGHLYSVCDDKVMAITDAATGHAVTRVTIGEGPDAAEYDASRGLVFSSNGRDGTLSIVHQDKGGHYTVQQTLATQRGARTMALDPQSGRIYLVTADFAPAPAGSTARPTPIPDSFTVLVVAPPSP